MRDPATAGRISNFEFLPPPPPPPPLNPLPHSHSPISNFRISNFAFRNPLSDLSDLGVSNLHGLCSTRSHPSFESNFA